MYKYIIWILFLTDSLVLQSCNEEFLTKQPPGVAAGSVIESPEGIEAILIGTYASIRGTSIFGGAMGTDWTYGSAYSDDCHYGNSAGNAWDVMDNIIC